MKKLMLLCATLVLACADHASAARTDIVTFQVDGQKVVGTLVLPEGQPAPVVLMFHGFSGQRNEMALPLADGQGIFTRAASAWADEGIATLRIDFRGSGESEGSFADTTFSGQIADGLAAVSYLQSDKRVDGKRLGIVGWSQGGLVAAIIAGRSNAPKAVALWNAVGEPLVTYQTLLGADSLAKGLKTGVTALEVPVLPWGFSVHLKQAFFDELATTHPLEEIKGYTGPLFVTEGTNDEAIAVGTGEKFIAAHDGPEELWIRPMDHAFNSLKDLRTLDEMIATTGGFMKKKL